MLKSGDKKILAAKIHCASWRSRGAVSKFKAILGKQRNNNIFEQIVQKYCAGMTSILRSRKIFALNEVMVTVESFDDRIFKDKLKKTIWTQNWCVIVFVHLIVINENC